MLYQREYLLTLSLPGDDYDKMVKGDPGVESIYNWTKSGSPSMYFRGASGIGDGVHIMTGPVYVCGAEPGDVLQIDILDLKPRPNPATGKTYGVNAAAWWGYQFRAGFLDGDKREIVTIYEIVQEPDGSYSVVPDYQFRFAGGPTNYSGPMTPCTATNGSMPRTAENFSVKMNNTAYTYTPGVTVDCLNGTQTWEEFYYPGVITSHPTGTEDYSIQGLFKVPANFHIGNIGLAPKYNSPVDSVPPLVSGGNMDNMRIGIGKTLYLPVQVAGAFLSAGDAHSAQGDSELDGTGVETSINGKLKLTLHKKDSLPDIVKDLDFPLIETSDSYVVQGYTYKNYLEELEEPMSTIYGESSTDKAMTVAYENVRDWLMRSANLTEDQAITAITIAVDFGITQVVDGNWGVHAIVPKTPFSLPDVGAKESSSGSTTDEPIVESASGVEAVGISTMFALLSVVALFFS